MSDYKIVKGRFNVKNKKERWLSKMRYAIIKVVNGNYFVHAEGITVLSSAKTQFHGLCQTLWNAPDVLNAYVMIVDEQLDCVEGFKEFIHHEAA